MEEALVNAPYQMHWFMFLDFEATKENIVLAHQIMDETCVTLAAEDPIWPPPPRV